MERNGTEQSGMAGCQFVSKDKHQEGSGYFAICKQHKDCQQCFATNTGSKLLVYINCQQEQLYNSPSAHKSLFSPKLWKIPQLPFENSSPPFHGQFFPQKNHVSCQNGHKEERSLANHEKEMTFYVQLN